MTSQFNPWVSLEGVDRAHREAMRRSSEALLKALWREHPVILDALTRRVSRG